MSGHRVKRLPIDRIGWRDALKLIREEGFTLQVYTGGKAELLSPTETVMGKKHSFTQGNCAYYYLTCRSTELLQAALKDSKGA